MKFDETAQILNFMKDVYARLLGTHKSTQQA